MTFIDFIFFLSIRIVQGYQRSIAESNSARGESNKIMVIIIEMIFHKE